MEFIICDCDIYDNNTGKFLLTMKELTSIIGNGNKFVNRIYKI